VFTVEFKTVPIHELRPCAWNTNFVSPANQAKLDASLKKFGLFTPIIVRRVAGEPGYEILGGEHRWEALKRAGYKEVAVADQGEIDDETAKALMLAANARYGADDALALAELLQGFKDEEFQAFLPYSDADVAAIFNSDIALEDLDLLDATKAPEEIDEITAPKAPKTHTMIRFKVPLEDAERITEIIERTKQDHGYTAEDAATNAGDALVHLLLRATK
jgi:ParB-like chromosome segregation protein Spo0J